MHTCPINVPYLHLSWIMWKIIDIHSWVFDGRPISWNTPFFLIIILDPEVSLKGFLHFKLTWFRLCSTTILLDECGEVMIYFNWLVLGTILIIFIFLNFLEILWSINTEEPMATEEVFVQRVNISAYQCD